MERAHDDNDDAKSEDKPSSLGRPVFKLNLRSLGGEGEAPKPPAPEPLRVPIGLERPPEASEKKDDDDDSEDDKKTIPAPPIPVKPVAPEALAGADQGREADEVAEATEEVTPSDLPPLSERMPEPVEEQEPWRPVPRPVAQPIEVSFFDRKADAEARIVPGEAANPTGSAAEASAEPVVAWQKRTTPPGNLPPRPAMGPTPPAEATPVAPIRPAEALPTVQPLTQAEFARAQQETNVEIRKLKVGQAAELLLTVALAGWFNHKLNKQRRQEAREFKKVHTALREQREQNADLRYNNQAQRRQIEGLDTRLKQQTEKVQEVQNDAEEIRRRVMAAHEAREAEQADTKGYHIERSWYDEVVDREGRVVSGAVEHGRAFHEERSVERAGSHLSFTPGQSGGAQDDQQQAYQALQQAHHAIQNTQVPSGYQMPPGLADAQRRALNEEQSKLKSTLTDPWIWVGMAVLLFAFLTAAFI